MHIPIVYAYAFKQFIISFHGVEWERMEESSKILKFYKSTRNGFQLRYCNSTYGNTPIISNVDENNIQITGFILLHRMKPVISPCSSSCDQQCKEKKIERRADNQKIS